jgi:spermidine/putrescine transport system ATP-binding protein
MNALHSLQTLAVSIRSVRKVYGDPQTGPVALKSIDLDIRDNEFFTLLGPSGCGKTTLLRMIAGFEFPTEGEIILYGENIADRPPFQRPVNTVFQHYALFPHMTIAENLAFGLESHPMGKVLTKAQIAERVREMLALVQMERFANRKPAQLSGGQQQRVALARALAPHPKVLLLDEPLSALDLKLRQAMREELKTIQAKTGITFIFVTHDQEEALTMSDRIAVLSEGEVQQVGRPEDIYERPRNRFVADFIGETNFIEGTVTRVDGGQAWFAGPAGHPLPAQPCSEVQVGANVTLSVRPERLHLVPAVTEAALPCRIEAQIYLGTDLQYQVSLSDGSRLTVRTPNCVDQSLRFAVGSQAGLLFDRGSASVLHD